MNDAVLAISCVTLGFLGYHFPTSSVALKAVFEKKWGAEKTLVRWIYFQRMAGVFFFGLVPATLLWVQGADFQQFGCTLTFNFAAWAWTAGLCATVVLLNYFAARSPDNLATYPQIRSRRWSRSLLAGSALTWTAYLAAYEFLFRGFLLFSCQRAVGDWLAVTLNVSLYTLIHLNKGWKETVGAIPLGVVLCLLTLKSGMVLPAVLIHVAMALSNEWWSLRWQPEMWVGRSS